MIDKTDKIVRDEDTIHSRYQMAMSGGVLPRLRSPFHSTATTTIRLVVAGSKKGGRHLHRNRRHAGGAGASGRRVAREGGGGLLRWHGTDYGGGAPHRGIV